MSPLAINILALCILAPIGLLGLLLMKMGFWPRRRGQTPHCRRCGYTLVGNKSGSCPECGNSLSVATVVHGERRRRLSIAWTGLALLLLTLAAGGGIWGWRLPEETWYHIWPSVWLAKDVSSADFERAAKAWTELWRRRTEGQLDQDIEAKLTEIALVEQGKAEAGALSSTLIEYLGQRAADKKLTAQQLDRFFMQGLNPRIQVRPVARAGDPLPVEISISGRGPATNWSIPPELKARWGLKIDCGKVRVDGVENGTGIGSGGSAFSQYILLNGTVVAPAEGMHKVEAPCHLEISYPWIPGTKRNTPFWSRDLVFQGQVQITPAGEDPLKIIDDPKLASAIRNIIHVDGVYRFSTNPRTIQYRLKLDEPPVDLALKAVGRSGTKEYLPQAHFDELIVPKGKKVDDHQFELLEVGPEINKIDLVLRGNNPQMTRATIDLHEVWTGQIVLENLEIQDFTK